MRCEISVHSMSQRIGAAVIAAGTMRMRSWTVRAMPSNVSLAHEPSFAAPQDSESFLTPLRFIVLVHVLAQVVVQVAVCTDT